MLGRPIYAYLGLGSISSMHKFVALLTICQSSPRQEQSLLSHHICGKVKQNTYLNSTTLKDPGSSKHECIGIQFPLHTGSIGDASENNPGKSEIKGQDLFLLTSLSNSALGFRVRVKEIPSKMLATRMPNGQTSLGHSTPWTKGECKTYWKFTSKMSSVAKGAS